MFRSRPCSSSVSECSRDDLHRVRVPDDVSPEVRVQRSRLQLPAGRRHRPVGSHLQRCFGADSRAPYHPSHLGQVHNHTSDYHDTFLFQINQLLLGGYFGSNFLSTDDRSNFKIQAKAYLTTNRFTLIPIDKTASCEKRTVSRSPIFNRLPEQLEQLLFI